LEHAKPLEPADDLFSDLVTYSATPQLKDKTKLVVDATGVGRPVVDMLKQRGLKPIAIAIHGGDTVSADSGFLRVPKRDLVAAVQVMLQTERLKFASAIPALPQLIQELLAFRVKIDPTTAHDSYGSWREGTHDDLVLALAVAAWYGERPQAPNNASLNLGSFSSIPGVTGILDRPLPGMLGPW
jgi:hypothetical protein